jgi:D-beta-D-heptose 7-phosphate kinase/D-beta-D-heptose 1-phosphate adenosyltransferase
VNQQQKYYKVILIGDNCIDEYHYGRVERLSPEAPVPIFCPTAIITNNGMAANVHSNLLKLDIGVTFHSTGVSKKIRMIDEKTKQHLLRIDHDVVCKNILFSDIDFKGADAVVISDYDKGTVTYDLIEDIQDRVDLPIFLDTKKRDLAKFDKCIVKINSVEDSNKVTPGNNVIVTHGGSHVSWGDKIYPVPTVPVFDVCGAGDTFLSSLVYQYLHTRSIHEGIKFAIRAAAVTVGHLGVYSPSIEEIEARSGI